MTTEYMWYAAYGSNLWRERFTYYLEGGAPPGSRRTLPGARRKDAPALDEPLEIAYELFFADIGPSAWGGGAAFLDHVAGYRDVTLGRMYLITVDQFEDIAAQENRQAAFALDLARIVASGSSDVLETKYGRIVHLGDRDGAPILTFTSPARTGPHRPTPPPEAYLRCIVQGLIETYGLGLEEAAHYLASKRGIREHYTGDTLARLLAVTSGRSPEP